MSHPDPRHDPENVRADDCMKHEAWFREWEEYQEWLSHQHTHDDFNDYEETE